MIASVVDFGGSSNFDPHEIIADALRMMHEKGISDIRKAISYVMTERKIDPQNTVAARIRLFAKDFIKKNPSLVPH